MNNKRIDYANIKNVTSQLKQNLAKKYNELGKINQDAGGMAVVSNPTGNSISDINTHQDGLDALFNDGVYNGNLVINGGITVDFVESAATLENRSQSVDIRLEIERILQRRGIFNQAQFRDSTNIFSTNLTIDRNTVINAPIINDPRIENAEFLGTVTGLDDIFSSGYVDIYSIESQKNIFDIHTRSLSTGVMFSYEERENGFLIMNWGTELDVFGNAWDRSYTNNFLKSEFADVLFKPKSDFADARFRIENMDVEISNKVKIKNSLDINNDLRIIGTTTGEQAIFNNLEVKETLVSKQTAQSVEVETIQFKATTNAYINLESIQSADNYDFDIIAINRMAKVYLRADRNNTSLGEENFNTINDNHIGETLSVSRIIDNQESTVADVFYRLKTIELVAGTPAENPDYIAELELTNNSIPSRVNSFNVPKILDDDALTIVDDNDNNVPIGFASYDKPAVPDAPDLSDYVSDINIVSDGNILIKAENLTLEVADKFIQRFGEVGGGGAPFIINSEATFGGESEFNGRVTFNDTVNFGSESQLIIQNARTVESTESLIGLSIGAETSLTGGIYLQNFYGTQKAYDGLIKDKDSDNWVLFSNKTRSTTPVFDPRGNTLIKGNATLELSSIIFHKEENNSTISLSIDSQTGSSDYIIPHVTNDNQGYFLMWSSNNLKWESIFKKDVNNNLSYKEGDISLGDGQNLKKMTVFGSLEVTRDVNFMQDVSTEGDIFARNLSAEGLEIEDTLNASLGIVGVTSTLVAPTVIISETLTVTNGLSGAQINTDDVISRQATIGTLTVTHSLEVDGPLNISNDTITAKDINIIDTLSLASDTSTISITGPVTGSATYILPAENGDSDGKYLRYKTEGLGTLEWALADTNRIFSGNSTISIADETISMSTSGTLALTIDSVGDVTLEKDLSAGNISADGLEIRDTLNASLGIVGVTSTLVAPTVIISETLTVTNTSANAQINTDDVISGRATIGTLTVTHSLEVDGPLNISNNIITAKDINIIDTLSLASDTSTIHITAPEVGNATYILPAVDNDVDGKYLRYQSEGTLVWAQLDSDKIFLGDSTISIANDTISMSTNGNLALTIDSVGDVTLEKDLDAGNISADGLEIESTLNASLGIVSVTSTLIAPTVIISETLTVKSELSGAQINTDDVISGQATIGTLTVTHSLEVDGPLNISNDTITAKDINIIDTLSLASDTSTISITGPVTGSATYILPAENIDSDGKYLRYKTDGLGTLEWALADTNRIFSRKSTISIADETISMSTSGTLALTIDSIGDVRVEKDLYTDEVISRQATIGTITVTHSLEVDGPLNIPNDTIRVKDINILNTLSLASDTSTIHITGPGTGNATYILPKDDLAGGRYLRYQSGGSGTLEWAQLDSDKIFIGDSTISIVTEKISMITNGNERLSIEPDGTVIIGNTISIDNIAGNYSVLNNNLDGGITNDKLLNSQITIGTTAVPLGDTITSDTIISDITDGQIPIIKLENSKITIGTNDIPLGDTLNISTLSLDVINNIPNNSITNNQLVNSAISFQNSGYPTVTTTLGGTIDRTSIIRDTQIQTIAWSYIYSTHLYDLAFGIKNATVTSTLGVVERASDRIIEGVSENAIGLELINGILPAPGSPLDERIFAFKSEGGTDIVTITTGYGSVGDAGHIPDGELRVKGDIIAFHSSDRRLKTNIKKIENSINKIKQISGVSFDWSEQYLKARNIDGYYVKQKDIGVIADEIEKVLPEIVVTRSSGYKAVKYEKITPLLIEGIKELIDDNTKLNENVNYLMKRIEKMENEKNIQDEKISAIMKKLNM